VAEHAGQRERQGAGRDAQVGVAEAGRDDPDQDLVRARLGQVDVGEVKAAPAASTIVPRWWSSSAVPA
jgi:hypothetical protein